MHNLTLRPDLDELSPGGRYGLAIANSQGQASILVAHARRLVERSPLLRSQLVQAYPDRLVFKDGRVLLAMPCLDRLQRGLTASMVALDELAHFLDSDGSPAQAERVYAAVRPSLVVFGERSKLVAISTPLGGDNLFARLHARAAAGELPSGAAFTASTLEMNPRVSAEFLEGERLLLGEADYAREYEAQFTGGGAAFFEEEPLRTVVGRYRELPPDQGTAWLVSFDPSFSVDPSAAAVVGRSKADRRQLVCARVERWLPRAKTGRLKQRRRRQSTTATENVVASVLDAVAALSKAYGWAPVLTDQHAPSVVTEGLKARGVAQVRVVPWTAQSQSDSFRALRAHVYQGSITLPDAPELVSELLRLTTRVGAGGSQVRVPRSGASHCDQAVSLALGVAELDRRGLPSRGRIHSAVAGRTPRDPLQRDRFTPNRDGSGLEHIR